MASNAIYKTHYTGSRALVVGINKYQSASPLEFACNDANAVADILKERFSFPNDSVSILQDDKASKEGILSEFVRFTNDEVDPDERIIFFFAGHGYTKVGWRGEIGFLVPFDGDMQDINSLIRWDELTRNAELIRAKHVLFVVDACYGGTAVQRSLPPGSMRFARDMLRRFSRQVLTAGKADQAVADSGGPRVGHSVFTGYLLDGLDGAAVGADRLLTANKLMAYVYDKVAKDYQSQQTPHYGPLDGDGDMIFDMTPLEGLEDSPETEQDILVQIPADAEPQGGGTAPSMLADMIKEYLSDSRHRIRLHDTVSSEIRGALAKTGIEALPIQGLPFDRDVFANRLSQYEAATSSLVTIVILLARWGDQSHRKTLEMVFSRSRDNQSVTGGLSVYLGLQWYPVSFLAYVAGISALAADNYENLATIFLAPIQETSRDSSQPVILPTVQGILEVERSNAFKLLPGHERNFTPRSEYMFTAVQPYVDDSLFLGRDYERQFDRFEILLALVYADFYEKSGGGLWGPIGRFAWKFSSLHSPDNPLEEFLREGAAKKDDWPLLRAGLFSGSYARFEEMSTRYRELLSNLNWY